MNANLNANVRQRKENKKTQKRENIRVERKVRKIATKITTLIAFKKPIQSEKKHRENTGAAAQRYVQAEQDLGGTR